MSSKQKRIGILGGTFDPVHCGHVSIAESFLKADLLDELWILLTPDPPHKTGQAQADYSLRMKMLQEAFKGFDDVKVSDIEKQLSQPSYTVQTLEYLKNKYPDYTFYLCIGGDSLHNFKKWKDWKKILQLSDLFVAQRPSTDIENIDESIKEHLHFADHEPIRVSSTMVREAIAKGRNISELLPSSVKKIIDGEELYQLSDNE